jgi:hypothetical protein
MYSKQQHLERQVTNRTLLKKQSERWKIRTGSSTVKLSVNKTEVATSSSSDDEDKKEDSGQSATFTGPTSPSPSTNSSPQASPITPLAPATSSTPPNPLQTAPTQPFPVDILFEQHSLKPKTSVNLSSYTNHISDETMELILSHNTLMNEIVFEETMLTDAQLEIVAEHLQTTNRITSISLKSIETLSPGEDDITLCNPLATLLLFAAPRMNLNTPPIPPSPLPPRIHLCLLFRNHIERNFDETFSHRYPHHDDGYFEANFSGVPESY